MMPEKERFEELCAAMALGVLEEGERPLLEEGLRNGGEPYAAILRDSLAVTEHLNASVPRIAPDPSVKQRLMRSVSAPRVTAERVPLIDRIALFLGFGNPRIGLAVSLLLVVMVAAGSTLFVRMREQNELHQQRIAATESALADQQQRLTALQTELAKDRAMLDVLRSPKIAMVMMNGLEVNPTGFGKVIWDPVRKIAILQVAKLPAVPADKDYQLWYLDKEKKPVSAGVFAVGAEEEYFSVTDVPLPDSTADVTAFAVTIEPKGGVPQPTGAMYLLGSPTEVR